MLFSSGVVLGTEFSRISVIRDTKIYLWYIGISFCDIGDF